MESCRFVSSCGGVARCGGQVFHDGFCHFHFDCYRRGEITARGLISEKLSDQDRRREINFHALNVPNGRVA